MAQDLDLDQAVMMQNMVQAMTPGENHRKLDPLIGSWNIEVRVWARGPDQPPTLGRGASEVKWILDDRFVLEESRYEIAFPGSDGQPSMQVIQGLGIYGHDNYKNGFVGTFRDNKNTQQLVMRGTYDPKRRAFVWYGEMDEPAIDVTGRMIRYVDRLVDDDHHVFECYDLHLADDYKIVEIAYSRK